MSTQSADSVPVSQFVLIQPDDVIPAEVRETATRLGVSQYLPQVIDLTRQIYGGFTDVTVSDDPDFGDTHIVFHAPVICSVDEALDMDEAWSRGMLKIIPNSPQVYLAFAEVQL